MNLYLLHSESRLERETSRMLAYAGLALSGPFNPARPGQGFRERPHRHLPDCSAAAQCREDPSNTASRSEAKISASLHVSSLSVVADRISTSRARGTSPNLSRS